MINLFHTARVAEAIKSYALASAAFANVRREVANLELSTQRAVENLMAEAEGVLQKLNQALALYTENPETPDERWGELNAASRACADAWNNAAQIAAERGRLEELQAWLRAGRESVKELVPGFGWVPWVAGGALLLYAFLKGRQ